MFNRNVEHGFGILFILKVINVHVISVVAVLEMQLADSQNISEITDNSWQFDVRPASRSETILRRYSAFRKDFKTCRSNVTSCESTCGHFRAIPCSCDPHCHFYENCCEDFYDVCKNTTWNKTEDWYLSNTNLSVVCRSYVPYLLISGCPKGVDAETSRRCLKDEPTTLADVVPVSMLQSDLHFKNKFCAECNGIVQTQYWSGTVFGESGFTGLFNFIRDLSRKEVSIEWKNQQPTQIRSCFPTAHEKRSDVILTTDASSVICNTFTSYVYSNITNRYYRNRFCLQPDINTQVTCDPVTNVFIPPSGGQSFAFEKGNDGDDWLISEMSNSSKHVAVMTCDDNGTTSCRITRCDDSYTLREGSCQKRRVKVIIKSTVSPVDSGSLTHVHTVEAAVSILSQHLIRQVKSVGVKESPCVLDKDSKHLILDEDVSWKLEHTFLCKTDDDDSSKRSLFQTHLSSKLTKAVNLAFAQTSLNLTAKFDICLMDENSFSTVYDVCFQTTVSKAVPLSVAKDNQFAETIISNLVCSLSVVSLFVRLVLQTLIPFFQSAPGKIQFCLCLTLFIAYVVFLAGSVVPRRTAVCVVMALISHWAFLSALLWMHVIAFKMWQTFRSWKSQLNPQTTFTLRLSVVFCAIPPLLAVTSGLLLDNLLPDSEYSPNYGDSVCWISRSSSLIVLFVIPSNVIIIINSVLACLALRGIWKEREAFNVGVTRTRKIDLELAAKVIILVGVTWLVGLVAIVLKYSFVWMLFTVINGSLGFLISSVLLCNRRVVLFLKKAISPCLERVTSKRGGDSPIASVSTSAYKL